jgi:hypothetical protein
MPVGRARELDDLEQLLEAASLGRGGLRVIFGEPGIGKTRLATYRDAESRLAPVADVLARITREGSAFALRPLSGKM